MITILGGGESGVGAAVLAKKQGFDVLVSDYGQISDKYKGVLESYQIQYEEGQHTEALILSSSEVIKSPGIPDKVAIVKKIKAAGISIIDEIEFGFRYTNAKIIGITGSNGKTTTAGLTYHLLKVAGFNVGLGGNIGISFAKQVAENNYDYYVLELSSFQLDNIKTFRADIAILLNITPDHLDRYEYLLEKYIASKFRITQNQLNRDVFIYNGNDENTTKWLNGEKPAAKCEVITTQNYQSEPFITIENITFDTSELSIKGSHNLFNASCAILAVLKAGADKALIQKGLATFLNAPHRLESIKIINGIEYINDSKATNIDSVFHALKAMKKPIVWVAGGIDKGNDYRILEALVQQKVKALVCLGVDNEKMITAFSPMLKIIEEVNSAEEAVRVASKYGETGDVILLSPACSSFDLFKNYMDRGEQFKKAVYEFSS